MYVYNMNPDPDDLPQYSAAQEKENDGTLMFRLRCGFQTASKPALASSIEWMFLYCRPAVCRSLV